MAILVPLLYSVALLVVDLHVHPDDRKRDHTYMTSTFGGPKKLAFSGHEKFSDVICVSLLQLEVEHRHQDCPMRPLQCPHDIPPPGILSEVREDRQNRAVVRSISV